MVKLPVGPKQEPLVLIVDDDAGQRQFITNCLEPLNVQTTTAPCGDDAIKILETQNVTLIISDVRMPGISGLELLKITRERFATLPIILVTAYADIRDAVTAIQDGAVNYLEKPIDVDELRDMVIASLSLEASPEEDPLPPLPDGVLALSPAMKDVIRESALIAATDSRVLITGESGTGKEVIARLIHDWSHRKKGPLVRINCAAIPENLLESELFGHEKGAFTGAIQRRIGHFEEAHGGTIFLDEISEISSALQAKLLRVIQEGTFQRVGSNTELTTDTRVLAASNRDLEAESAAGRFREDLFFRLSVFEIHLAPLRERREDIVPLAEMFARRHTGGASRISTAAVTCLTLYDWPGNVRELQNAMERASLMSRGGIILPEHLPGRIRQVTDTSNSIPDLGNSPKMEDVERVVILQSLREHNFNRTETARALGISRRALIYKLRRFADEGIDVDSGGN